MIEVAGRKQQQQEEGMKKRKLQRVKRGYEKLCILLFGWYKGYR